MCILNTYVILTYMTCYAIFVLMNGIPHHRSINMFPNTQISKRLKIVYFVPSIGETRPKWIPQAKRIVLTTPKWFFGRHPCCHCCGRLLSLNVRQILLRQFSSRDASEWTNCVFVKKKKFTEISFSFITIILFVTCYWL